MWDGISDSGISVIQPVVNIFQWNHVGHNQLAFKKWLGHFIVVSLGSFEHSKPVQRMLGCVSDYWWELSAVSRSVSCRHWKVFNRHDSISNIVVCIGTQRERSLSLLVFVMLIKLKRSPVMCVVEGLGTALWSQVSRWINSHELYACGQPGLCGSIFSLAEQRGD